MEGLMKLLEQYWGLTIAGGVSVGTIITFVIVQIKVLMKDKSKNAIVNGLMKDVSSTVDKLNASESANAQLRSQTELANKVQATTFKAISYLVIASKLPNSEKIALQNEFTSLLTDTAGTVEKQALAEADSVVDKLTDVKDDVIAESKDAVVATVTNALATSSKLLAKYMPTDDKK